MKATIDDPGIKFKEKEKAYREVLPAKSIIGMRLDGKSFHTFTKQFSRPYDERFMAGMDATMKHLLDNVVSGAMFGYVQSDEITIFFSDLFGKDNTAMFSAGKVEKILSTTASAATGAFLRADPEVIGIPVFDCRLFVLDGLDEVQEYMDWRRLDARKNSITMAAGALYSNKQLHGVSTRERHALLEGTEFEVLPQGFFEGRVAWKKTAFEDVTFMNKKKKVQETLSVVRSSWVLEPAVRELVCSVILAFALESTPNTES